MTPLSLFERVRAGVVTGWSNRALSFKAISFGLIGVVNTVVDYGVFLAARALLLGSSGAQSAIAAVSDFCHCGDVATVTLIIANTVAWLVAVTGSYIMNSSITFAAESGRKLRWRAYFAFVVSGIAGWFTNTTTLIIVVEVLMLPVWISKAVAILASFIVNFSLSHFIVFRPNASAAIRPRPDA